MFGIFSIEGSYIVTKTKDLETHKETSDTWDAPAHPLCPAVRIRLEDVVEMLRLFPRWRLPAAPEIVCLS